MEIADKISSPSRDALELAENVYRSVQGLFPEAVANFESQWTAFQGACHRQAESASLDASTRTDEFEALKRQGPKILPFVVFKLATNTDANLDAVFLFYALENDPKYGGNPDDPLIDKEALLRHSTRILELNYERNKAYEQVVQAWKDYCEERPAVFCQAVCCSGDEYWDLLDVGPSFIPRLMVEYSHDTNGYWYELLHEIVHGHQMGAHMLVNRDLIINVWREFFNEREYEDAPKYVQTEWDIYIKTGEEGPLVQEWHRKFGTDNSIAD